MTCYICNHCSQLKNNDDDVCEDINGRLYCPDCVFMHENEIRHGPWQRTCPSCSQKITVTTPFDPEEKFLCEGCKATPSPFDVKGFECDCCKEFQDDTPTALREGAPWCLECLLKKVPTEGYREEWEEDSDAW